MTEVADPLESVAVPVGNARALASLTLGALAGLLTGTVVAATVWQHGPDARRASVLLLIAAVTLGAVSASMMLRRRPWAALVIAGMGVPVAVSFSVIGRAPGAVASTLTVLGVLTAVGLWPGRSTPSSPPMLLLALPTSVAALGYLVSGGPGFLVGVGAALVVIVAYLRGNDTAFAWDREVRRTVSRWTSRWHRPVIRRRPRKERHVRVPDQWLRRAFYLSAAIALGLLLPVFHRIGTNLDAWVVTNNDFTPHLRIARAMPLWPLEIPHPVFHLILRGFDALVGQTLAPALTMVLPVVVMAAGLVWLASEPGHRRAALGPVGVPVFVAAYLLSGVPAVGLSAIGLVDPAPYLTVHMWWSPTGVMMYGFAVALLPALVRLVNRAADPPEVGRPTPAPLAWLVLGLTVVSTLSKPSLAVAMVPGVLLYLAWSGRWNVPTLRAVVTWFIAPAAVVIIWQTWLTQIVQAEESGGISIAPLQHVRALGFFDGGLLFYSSLLPTIIAVLYAGRRFTREPHVQLVVASLIFTIPPMLLLTENGIRQADGIFLLPFATCWMLLWLLTVRFWAFELRAVWSESGRGAQWRRVGILAGAVVVVGSGLVAHLDAMGVHRFDIL